MAFVRARKRVVSILAESRAGRSTLLRSLGDADVAQVLESISAVVEAARGDDADTVARNTIKLAGKLFVLIRAGSIPPRELVPMQIPMATAGMKLHAALELAAKADASRGSADARAADHTSKIAQALSEVAEAVASVAAATVLLAGDKLKSSSISQLIELGQLYASERFLNYLLTAPEISAHRALLLRSIGRVTRRGATQSDGTSGASHGSSVTRHSRNKATRSGAQDWPTGNRGSASSRSHSSARADGSRAQPDRSPALSSAESGSVTVAALSLSSANDDASGSQIAPAADSSLGSFPARTSRHSPAHLPVLSLVGILARPEWQAIVSAACNHPPGGRFSDGGARELCHLPPALLRDWLEVPECASAFTEYVAEVSQEWRSKVAAGESLGHAYDDPAPATPSLAVLSPRMNGHAGSGAPPALARSGSGNDSDGALARLPCDPKLLLELRHVMLDYRAVSNRKLRAQRGRALFAKYLQRPSVDQIASDLHTSAVMPSRASTEASAHSSVVEVIFDEDGSTAAVPFVPSLLRGSACVPLPDGLYLALHRAIAAFDSQAEGSELLHLELSHLDAAGRSSLSIPTGRMSTAVHDPAGMTPSNTGTTPSYGLTSTADNDAGIGSASLTISSPGTLHPGTTSAAGLVVPLGDPRIFEGVSAYIDGPGAASATIAHSVAGGALHGPPGLLQSLYASDKCGGFRSSTQCGACVAWLLDFAAAHVPALQAAGAVVDPEYR